MSGMSPYNDSLLAGRSSGELFRTTLSSSMRITCLNRLHRRSLIIIGIFSGGVRASSAKLRPVLLESILDTVVLSLRCTWFVIFPDYPRSSVVITDAFNHRNRSLPGSLGVVRIRLRYLYRDQAISTRQFTGTNGSPSPDCKTPRHLKWILL